MKMTMEFPGGVKVAARLRDHTVLTDQDEKGGGEGSAPAPFDLFLASVGTCAAFYALRFCQQRDIETSGLGMALETVRDPETKRLDTIRMELTVPAAFPQKYKKAVVRAIDQCAVKRAIVDPPDFETVVTHSPRS
jgi:ribosomal protein S12 methylthiotransferase accessory factor